MDNFSNEAAINDWGERSPQRRCLPMRGTARAVQERMNWEGIFLNEQYRDCEHSLWHVQGYMIDTVGWHSNLPQDDWMPLLGASLYVYRITAVQDSQECLAYSSTDLREKGQSYRWSNSGQWLGFMAPRRLLAVKRSNAHYRGNSRINTGIIL